MASFTQPATASGAVPTPTSLAVSTLYFDSTLNAWCQKNNSASTTPIAGYTANVVLFGADPSGVAASDTAFTNAIAGVFANGAGSLYVPPGTYRFATGNITISSNYLKVFGNHRYATNLLMQHTSNDLFVVSQWYAYFEDLHITSPETTMASSMNALALPQAVINVASTTNFAASGSITVYDNTGTAHTVAYTSVVGNSFQGCTGGSGTLATGGVVAARTGGYAIDNATSQASTVVRNCQVDNQYNGVNFTGALNEILRTEITQSINFGLAVSTAGAEPIVDDLVMNGLPQAAGGIEVVSCGSLQILNSNIIHSGNDIDLNANATGIFSVYATNTFFDTAVCAMNVRGTGNIQRCQLNGCWFSSQSTWGIILNNALIAGLNLVNCHAHLNTSGGIEVLAALQWTAQSCQLSSASAGVGTGISVANTASMRFLVNGCLIGGFGGGQNFATGVSVGAGTYGSYALVANDLALNTASLVDSGSVAVSGQKVRQSNIGCPNPGAAIVGASAAINTTDTVLATCTVGSGVQAGTTMRAKVSGTCTTSLANLSTFTLRYGTLGTTGDATVATVTVTSAATGTAIEFEVEIDWTVRTLGGAATLVGVMRVTSTGAATGTSTGIQAFPVTVTALTPSTFNSAQVGVFSLSYKTAAATTTSTFQTAQILPEAA